MGPDGVERVTPVVGGRSLLGDWSVPAEGATEVLGHDGHAHVVIGSHPTADCFGREAAVAERADEHAARSYDSGHLVEHFDGLREVVDRHATDGRGECGIDEGERRSRRVIEVETNGLVSHSVRGKLRSIHPNNRERGWLAREVRNPRRHEIKDRSGVCLAQAEFLVERSDGGDSAVIDVCHHSGVVVEPIIGRRIGSIEEAIRETLIRITHIVTVLRRPGPRVTRGVYTRLAGASEREHM